MVLFLWPADSTMEYLAVFVCPDVFVRTYRLIRDYIHVRGKFEAIETPKSDFSACEQPILR